MGKLLRKKIREDSEQDIRDDVKKEKDPKFFTPIDTDIIVSTGSTLLDLAISGGRVYGGGIPGGIMVELHGPSSSGKTAVVVELASSIQAKGGEADFMDPEARLDKEYASIYGLKLDVDNYSKPKTVKEVFDRIHEWEPENKKAINGKIVDSIAALCSQLELAEGGDKRGQAKAKELHAGCRRTATEIADDTKLVVFTNHEMDGEYGKTTPGGKAVPYYASLRIRIVQKKPLEVSKTLKNKKVVKKVIGIHSECLIKKSSVDDGFRSAPLYIVYGLGIDDVRGNLQWYKDMTKGTKYDAIEKEFRAMADAIKCIEENNLEGELRERVINLWNEIESKFKVKRKKKVRF